MAAPRHGTPAEFVMCRPEARNMSNRASSCYDDREIPYGVDPMCDTAVIGGPFPGTSEGTTYASASIVLL
jgi:hypothetical protein